MYSDLPKAIRSKEHVWAESFENFAELLPFNGEQSDALFEFELPSMCADPRHFLQVSIGRFFDPEGWTMDEVNYTAGGFRDSRVAVTVAVVRSPSPTE